MSEIGQEHEDDSATKDTKATKQEHKVAPSYEPVPATTDLVSNQIIGAAIQVHRTLGPGFLEKIEECPSRDNVLI